MLSGVLQYKIEITKTISRSKHKCYVLRRHSYHSNIQTLDINIFLLPCDILERNCCIPIRDKIIDTWTLGINCKLSSLTCSYPPH